MYIPAEIEMEARKSGFTGSVFYQPETGSTNTDAREAALTGAPHGSIWLADAQSEGRGRADHRWESVAGKGLYLSILLRPKISANDLQWLPLATGLAAADAIGALTQLKVDLRWPNDLLIGQRKAGGILVESKITNTAGSASVEFVVVGIGINVHQLVFPQELDATSLDLELERKCREQAAPQPSKLRRQMLLVKFLERFAEELKTLETDEGREAIAERVCASSSWIKGRAVQVHGPQACTGQTAGIDSNGMLLVETADGLRTITTGGIRALMNEK